MSSNNSHDNSEYEDKPKQKLTYRERYELEHTYAAYKGQRHGKSKQERWETDKDSIILDENTISYCLLF